MKRLLLIAIVLAACGKPAERKAAPPPPPARAPLLTIAEAALIIADSPDFGEYQFTRAGYTLPLKVSLMNAPARKAAADLAAAGWIRMRGDDVVLSDKAKSDRRWLVRPNGYVDIVPLAKKEFGAVTAVQATSEGADAGFTWTWNPNDVAKAFRSGEVKERFEGTKYATATLMWDGKGWSVLRIREASPARPPAPHYLGGRRPTEHCSTYQRRVLTLSMR
jgi:hypothetical protein